MRPSSTAMVSGQHALRRGPAFHRVFDEKKKNCRRESPTVRRLIEGDCSLSANHKRSVTKTRQDHESCMMTMVMYDDPY